MRKTGHDDFLELLFDVIRECQDKGSADGEDLEYMALLLTAATNRTCANAINALCDLQDVIELSQSQDVSAGS